MVKGYVSTVLSSRQEVGEEIAGRLGKRSEGNSIYYRRVGEAYRWVLVPKAERLLDQAAALTASSSFYLALSEELGPRDGDLILLAEASGLPGVTLGGGEVARRALKGLNILGTLGEFREADREVEDLGFVTVDRAFNVKGVGTVVLGFAFTRLRVHDRLSALGKEVEVKSIQVMDEDQDEVFPGTRVGLALRGAEVEELNGVQFLRRP